MTKNNELQKVEYVDYIPPADVVENSKTIHLLLDMPGAVNGRMTVEVKNRLLKIIAETCQSRKGKVIRYVRSFQVSDEIVPSEIKAELKDGVLFLALPKSEVAKVHKVPVLAE